METLLHRSTETGDQASIEQVIDAVQRLFSAVARLSETSHVSRAPIRVVIRIVFASTLMLKVSGCSRIFSLRHIRNDID